MVGMFMFCFGNQSMGVFSEVTVNALGEKCNVIIYMPAVLCCLSLFSAQNHCPFLFSITSVS